MKHTPFREWTARPFTAMLILSLAALACLATGVHAATMEVLTPRSGTTVYARHPETHLVLRQKWILGAGPVRAYRDGTKLDPVVVMQHMGDDYLHFRLPLEPGANTFRIEPGGERIEINYSPVQAVLNLNALRKDAYLFHEGEQLPKVCANCHDLQKVTNLETLGIKKQVACASCHRNSVDKAPRQHSTTVNRQCLACHQQFVQPWRIGFPAGKLEDVCFTCHTGKEAWRSRKYIHGPMTAGGCTLCHNPHGEENRYQLWADGAVDLCISCHSDKENLIGREKTVPFVHGILHGPGCVACHDPHASDHRFILHAPINELCVGCHSGLSGIKRGHPVGGHPVSGPNERRRKGRELSCTSCHDPHGAPYKYMLFAESRGGHVCAKCHR